MKHSDNWWFSADGKRGFCWDAVKGFALKEGNSGSGFPTMLYLYLSAAILHLSGPEADAVYRLLPHDSDGLVRKGTELPVKRGAQPV